MQQKEEVQSESWKLSRPYTYFNRIGNTYIDGLYYFAAGIVEITADVDYAHFRFIYHGRVFELCFRQLVKPYTERQLSIRAGKFGRAIVKEYGKG